MLGHPAGSARRVDKSAAMGIDLDENGEIVGLSEYETSDYQSESTVIGFGGT